MSSRRIPVEPGAHVSFRVTLDDKALKIRLNWLTRFEYFSVDIDVDGERVASGRGLHPEINLLEGTEVSGRLFISGAQPTPGNLGDSAVLRYEAPNG